MKILSDWRSVRLWESQVERDLHREHSLRTHGLLIGTFMLLLMWAVSALQMHLFHVDALALRYLLTLGIGYVAYLLVLRWWAARLVQGRAHVDVDGGDAYDAGEMGFESHADLGGGGGGGASDLLSDVAGGAFEAAGSADEGAIIVVPIVAVFLVCTAVLLGAGLLVMLYFSWDALLAVALELAFSYVSARAAVRIAREGWLLAAVRLTWKPLLGAVVCAVILGAVLDHFMPQAHSLPQAVRLLMSPRH